jgi:hypothetical protein
MDRASFRVAALAAAALLVIACADARADPGAAPPELATSGAEQSPPTDAPPPATPAEGTTAEQGSLDEGALGAQQEGVEQQLAQEPPAGDPPVQRQGPASPSGPPPGAISSPGGPEGQGGAPDLSVQPIGGSAPSAPELPIVAQSAYAPAPLLGAIEPGHFGGVRAPPDSRPLGSSLERLLPGVERELRTVQAQIDDLGRRLDRGAPAPKRRLIRLRSSLERIAPVLLALEVQLDAAGRLSPRLRALLHRVRVRLVGARASAADLIAALRRAGARGPELRLLLRELGRFRMLHAALASNLGAERAPVPSEPGANAAYTQVQPAPAASPQHAATAPLERRTGGRLATASADRGGPDEPAPGSSAPGSASASPGGAFSAASVALLATLLIGLALSRLRARLTLSPGRRYTVAFLAPLERPG